jgi:multiple sugar transport system substrate-binding protein
MTELELTLMAAAANPTAGMLALLDDFETEHKITASIKTTQWNMAHSELMNYALFKDTPDVSETGSTWISGFASMNALRPFHQSDMIRFGSQDAFASEAWKSGVLPDRSVYAVPWTVDVRNIYYRRDLFDQAGIDESTAFQNISNLQDAWRKLQSAGIEFPWVLTTGNTFSMLHYLASWVWGSGGRFISEDGKRPRFNEPVAKEAIYHYFADQLPFLTDPVRNLGDAESAALFQEGKVATIFSGYWLLDMVTNDPDTPPEVVENLGIAKFPMPAYVGGSHLVIWKSARHPDDAVKLIAYLTSREVQASLPQRISQIPARIEALEDVFTMSDPHYRPIIESLKTGRTFTAPYMWTMVEARLLSVVVRIWQELFEDPEIDLKAILAQNLDTLASRLEMSFSA